jgi:uncharacterized protein YndB with AHSA1/START domain
MAETYTAAAAMLIRRPAAEVYEAFVDPAVTSRFWFTEGSARLDSGEPVTWTWGMYGVSASVTVRELVPNARIAVEWGDPGQATPVTWTFTDRGDGTTFVEIVNDGLGSVEELAGSTGGFTLVLAGAKAWLEHGIELNLVADRFPDGISTGE